MGFLKRTRYVTFLPVCFQLPLGRRRASRDFPVCFGWTRLLKHLPKQSTRPLLVLFCISRKRRQHLSNATCNTQTAKNLTCCRMTAPPEFTVNMPEVSRTAASRSALALRLSLQPTLSAVRVHDRWIQRGKSGGLKSFYSFSYLVCICKPSEVRPCTAFVFMFVFTAAYAVCHKS